MECFDERCISLEHEEEIFVLKSIFNEDFVPIDHKDHSSTFDLIIRFDYLPNKILVIDEESNASTELSHLPPVILRMTYKRTYPEKDSPIYYILCDYLTAEQLLSLANQMDAVWEAGAVIVYTWIELIKEYFYNISNELILRSTKSSIDDQRFLSNYDKIGSKQIYEQLIEYNRIQNQLEFEQTIHTCPICLQDDAGKNCLQFELCHHYACLSCLNSYANEYLSNSQQNNKQINCYQCNSSLFLSELRRMFSDDKFLLKYQQRLLEQTVDMVWCPRCHHSIICTPSESTSGNHLSFAECFHCHFTFCRRCQESWHPQIECPKDKLLQNLTENHEQIESQPNKIQIEKLLIEISNIRMIEHCSKPCPSCGVRIEKNGGCQHMNCQACQVHFVGHADASLPSAMNEQIERVFYDENGKQIRPDIAKGIQLCPRENCRQFYVKIGTNNMLICGKCATNFCFLCGETIYGKFHFSQYGCLEHTRI